MHIDQKLIEFGNTTKAIPYYAVYKPGKKPLHFAGNFLTPKSFLDKAEISATPETPKDAMPEVAEKVAPAKVTEVSGTETIEFRPLPTN